MAGAASATAGAVLLCFGQPLRGIGQGANITLLPWDKHRRVCMYTDTLASTETSLGAKQSCKYSFTRRPSSAQNKQFVWRSGPALVPLKQNSNKPLKQAQNSSFECPYCCTAQSTLCAALWILTPSQSHFYKLASSYVSSDYHLYVYQFLGRSEDGKAYKSSTCRRWCCCTVVALLVTGWQHPGFETLLGLAGCKLHC